MACKLYLRFHVPLKHFKHIDIEPALQGTSCGFQYKNKYTGVHQYILNAILAFKLRP